MFIHLCFEFSQWRQYTQTHIRIQVFYLLMLKSLQKPVHISWYLKYSRICLISHNFLFVRTFSEHRNLHTQTHTDWDSWHSYRKRVTQWTIINFYFAQFNYRANFGELHSYYIFDVVDLFLFCAQFGIPLQISFPGFLFLLVVLIVALQYTDSLHEHTLACTHIHTLVLSK